MVLWTKKTMYVKDYSNNNGNVIYVTAGIINDLFLFFWVRRKKEEKECEHMKMRLTS